MFVPNREGSIPLVLLVVTFLGIGAGAALFSTLGNTRLDKRADLNERARLLAQCAVEETLVKVTNSAADYLLQDSDGDTIDARFTYEPFATEFMAQRNEAYADFELEPVEVFGRRIEAPNDATLLEKFKELMTQGPGFAKDGARRKMLEHLGLPTTPENMKMDWRELLDANAATVKTKDGFKWWGDDTNAVYKMVLDLKTEGEHYHDEHFEDYYTKAEDGDGGVVYNAFSALDYKVLDPIDWSSDPMNKAHSDAELESFTEAWDESMDRVADRVRDRIAGCAGNPNYGVGAMIAALTLGASVVADSEAEEELRETAQDSGILGYKSHLLTVQGTAIASIFGGSVKKQITAHRIVSRIDFKEAMDLMRELSVPYLITYYNFTPKDLEKLGWISPLALDKDGNLEKIIVTKDIFTKLAERYPDNPSPRIVPFQAATCNAPIKS